MEIDRLLKKWSYEPALTLMFEYMRVQFPTHEAKSVITKILCLPPEHLIFEGAILWLFDHVYFSNIQVMVTSVDSVLARWLK